MIDNSEVNRILEILENMEDEVLATSLLREFNEATKAHGVLLLNMDDSLSNEDWKKRCDESQKKVDEVVSRINQYS